MASKHARELQQLKDSLEEALQALSCAREEQAAAEMHHSGQERRLEQQHEQLTQKLQAQHKLELQVRLAGNDTIQCLLCPTVKRVQSLMLLHVQMRCQ